jgi:hypothetical protein
MFSIRAMWALLPLLGLASSRAVAEHRVVECLRELRTNAMSILAYLFAAITWSTVVSSHASASRLALIRATRGIKKGSEAAVAALYPSCRMCSRTRYNGSTGFGRYSPLAVKERQPVQVVHLISHQPTRVVPSSSIDQARWLREF